MKIIISLFCAIAGGLLYSMGFPHVLFNIGPIGPLVGLALLFSHALPLLFAHPSQPAPKSHLIWPLLILFLLFINLFGYYWIPYTISEFGEIHFPWNYLISTLFALIILPQLIVFFGILQISRGRIKILHTPLALAILMTALEFLIPQQFPSHLGHSWLTQAPYLFFAPIFGVPFYSFILYWPLFSLLRTISRRKPDFSLAMSVSQLIAVLLISYCFPLSFNPDRKLTIRMVQANIGNNLKIESEKFLGTAAQTVQDLYSQLSLGPSSSTIDDKIDLIIWPETAYPRLMQSSEMSQTPMAIPLAILDTVSRSKAWLFTGGYDLVENNEYRSHFENQYNAAFLFSPNQGEAQLVDYYHKTRLIPFGETLPFGPLNNAIGDLIPNISFFAQGERFPLFKLNDYHFISAICYEVLFSTFVRHYLNQHQTPADFLVNISNDSWYGKTIEPEQHLFLTHWRAIENNLPIVRMTNTGISSILYPDGSESARTKIQSSEVVDLPLLLAKRTSTPYQRWGDWGIVVLWLILGLVSMARSEAFLKQIVKTKKT